MKHEFHRPQNHLRNSASYPVTLANSPTYKSPHRPLSPLLATAIIACWPLFVWFLLGKGYAPSARRAAFIYAWANLAAALAGAVFAR